ncbi:MAG: hypothetical protein ABIH34_07790, partial [Nanoarchaeota archaeon]
ANNNTVINVSTGQVTCAIDFMGSENNVIVDSNLTPGSTYTLCANEFGYVYGQYKTNNTLINTNFSSTYFAAGYENYNFIIKWPINIYVNETNKTKVIGATVTTVDAGNRFTQTGTSGNGGWTGILNLTKEIMNGSGNFSLLPSNITASLARYVTGRVQYSFSGGNLTHISLVPYPLVNLSYPLDATITSDNPVRVICNATDDVELKNITLLNNATDDGHWQENGTIDLDGSSETFYSATFLIEGISYEKIVWNCEAYSDRPKGTISPYNFTLFIDQTGPSFNAETRFPAFNGYGQNITLQVEVTDANGIDTVYASLTSLDGPERNITLESQGNDLYAINYSNWTPTTFTFWFWANDTLGNNASVVPLNDWFHIYANMTVNISVNGSIPGQPGHYLLGRFKPITLTEYGNNISGIWNNGTTNSSFYLLTKTQYYNQGTWEDEDVLVDDIDIRALDAYNQFLAIDTIWNAHDYNTSNLTSGTGMYRAWVALTDDRNNILLNQSSGQIIGTKNFTYDAKPPGNFTIYAPPNFVNDSNLSFNFSVFEDLAPTFLCNITIDDANNVSNFNATNATEMNITINGFQEGNHSFNITCWDDAMNVNISNNYWFYLDQGAPVINLDYPDNNTWYNTSDINLSYTVTDLTLDTCLLYGDFNQSWIINHTNKTIVSGVQDILAFILKNGTYLWNVWCNDSVGNYAWNATNFTFHIDTQKPDIELHYPLGSFINETWINFNWTATDVVDQSLQCNLTINGTVNESNIAADNGTPTNFTVYDFLEGTQFWNVTCWNDANYTNTSVTANFTVDLHWPSWTTNQTNTTSTEPIINSTLQLNVTLNDTSGLEYYVFSWNHSGEWVNYTPIHMSHKWGFVVHYNVTVNQTGKPLVGWRIHFNDSAGHRNQTDIFTFQMFNTAPYPIFPGLPHNNTHFTNRTIQFNWTTSFDPDGDSITYNISVIKKGGDGSCAVADDRANFTTTTNITLSDFQCLYDENYYYNWTIAVYDGTNYSSWTEWRNFSIDSSVSILLLNDTILFGEDLSLGETKNTTDDALNPFLIENDGNVRENVNITATSLWGTSPSPTEDYQFKVNDSDEGRTFNGSATKLTWTNVPLITGNIVAVGGFDYHDFNDTARVDIKVTVPVAELYGNKTSAVTFEARRE